MICGETGLRKQNIYITLNHKTMPTILIGNSLKYVIMTLIATQNNCNYNKIVNILVFIICFFFVANNLNPF